MIKKILAITFIIIFFTLAFFSLKNVKPIDLDVFSAFLSNSEKGSTILKLSKINSNKIDVIFEGENADDVENLKEDFLEQIDRNDFQEKSFDFNEITEIYKENPYNFLTYKTKKLLESENYQQVRLNSLNMLYNPMGVFIETPDKDPYLFLTDYILSLNDLNFKDNDVVEFNDKFYSILTLSLKNQDMSCVQDLIKLSKENKNKIYFAGSLIHSFKTKQISIIQMNIIGILSLLALILLCLFYFRNIKILLPISLSIGVGLLFGYLMTNLIFSSINILTFVFSMTLIGVSLDYSLHYFLAEKNKKFYKSLTTSMLTTVFAFAFLWFTNIEVLKEIACFTGFGLIGVYLFVTVILPLFNFKISKENFIKIPNLTNYKKPILIVLSIIIYVGFLKISFDDSVKSLYKPSKELIKSETIMKNINKKQDLSFILVEGNSLDEIISNEEKITDKLNEEKIPYMSLSKIIPSEEKQLENQNLIKKIYKKDLDNYASFLDKKTKNKLKNSFEDNKFVSAENLNIKDFLLDEKTSFIVIPKNTKTEFHTVDISDNINMIIKTCRKNCQRILPVIFLFLYVFVSLFYGFKNGFKIILAPLLSILFTSSILFISGFGLNIFNIIGLFLVLGFSLDYSIFRMSKDKNSKDAVFISSISTAFSFLLLSFTSFKLISSLGFVLYVGILTSYMLSLVLLADE